MSLMSSLAILKNQDFGVLHFCRNRKSSNSKFSTLPYFGVKIWRPWKCSSKTFLCESFARSLVKFNGLDFEEDSPCLDIDSLVLGLLVFEEETIVGFLKVLEIGVFGLKPLITKIMV
ncbi:hypothetical protein Lal_00018685 [Lupinus albus]|nr:hypothetical protein Lal_00018685 [Lupinus albus]